MSEKIRRPEGLESLSAIKNALYDFMQGAAYPGSQELANFFQGPFREQFLLRLNVGLQRTGEEAYYETGRGFLIKK